MKAMHNLPDRLAVGLSTLCLAHCLALPLLLVLLPNSFAHDLEGEAFHAWLLIVALPVSLYALTVGCKQHQRYRVFALGIVGLCLLFAALLLGGSVISEFIEKSLTLMGASVIIIGHYWNFRLCRAHKNCACPGHQAAAPQ